MEIQGAWSSFGHTKWMPPPPPPGENQLLHTQEEVLPSLLAVRRTAANAGELPRFAVFFLSFFSTRPPQFFNLSSIVERTRQERENDSSLSLPKSIIIIVVVIVTKEDCSTKRECVCNRIEWRLYVCAGVFICSKRRTGHSEPGYLKLIGRIIAWIKKLRIIMLTN